MGFSLKRMFKIPKSVRKWQPLKSPIVKGLAIGAAALTTGGLGAGIVAKATGVFGKIGERLEKGSEALGRLARNVSGASQSFREAAGNVAEDVGEGAGRGFNKQVLPWILGGGVALLAFMFFRKRGR